ncbi:MAG: DUF362 domain-containing protein [Methanosarcinaceae archaeon]
MERRKFLQAVGSSVVFGRLANCEAQPETQAESPGNKSRVVIVQQKNVNQASLNIDYINVQKLLDEGMRRYFEIESLAKIWRKIVRPADVVGIKVNCLAGRGLSTHPALVDAIIHGLQMAGVKEKNILVWDRLNDDLKRAGFPVRPRGRGVRYLGNDSAGYSRDLVCYGAVGSLVSRLVTDYCTVLINVPILKDHGIVGVSVALKNYFGAIHNPNKYHDNLGNPYIADVNMFPDIRKKTRFTICDALVAQYEGGPPFMPQWAWPFGGLILGNDMVAIDQLGWQIIEEKRREKGMKSLREVKREPNYIATAASAEYQLGTNDPGRIERVHCFVTD